MSRTAKEFFEQIIKNADQHARPATMCKEGGLPAAVCKEGRLFIWDWEFFRNIENLDDKEIPENIFDLNKEMERCKEYLLHTAYPEFMKTVSPEAIDYKKEKKQVRELMLYGETAVLEGKFFSMVYGINWIRFFLARKHWKIGQIMCWKNIDLFFAA